MTATTQEGPEPTPAQQIESLRGELKEAWARVEGGEDWSEKQSAEIVKLRQQVKTMHGWLKIIDFFIKDVLPPIEEQP